MRRREKEKAPQTESKESSFSVKPDWSPWFSGLLLASQEARRRSWHGTEGRLRRACAFIEENYQQPLDLDAIARQACFSRYHFLRLFRQRFGTTPHQYLIERRLERAKELLKTSDLSVTEVCLEVGFQSLGSFSELFRRYVGHAPSRYRARVFASPGLGLVAIPSCFLAFFRGPRAQM